MWALTSPHAPCPSRASDTPLAIVFPTALRDIGFSHKNTDAVRRGLPVFKGLKSSQTQDEELKHQISSAAQNEKVKVL